MTEIFKEDRKMLKKCDHMMIEQCATCTELRGRMEGAAFERRRIATIVLREADNMAIEGKGELSMYLARLSDTIFKSG